MSKPSKYHDPQYQLWLRQQNAKATKFGMVNEKTGEQLTCDRGLDVELDIERPNVRIRISVPPAPNNNGNQNGGGGTTPAPNPKPNKPSKPKTKELKLAFSPEWDNSFSQTLKPGLTTEASLGVLKMTQSTDSPLPSVKLSFDLGVPELETYLVNSNYYPTAGGTTIGIEFRRKGTTEDTINFNVQGKLTATWRATDGSEVTETYTIPMMGVIQGTTVLPFTPKFTPDGSLINVILTGSATQRVPIGTFTLDPAPNPPTNEIGFNIEMIESASENGKLNIDFDTSSAAGTMQNYGSGQSLRLSRVDATSNETFDDKITGKLKITCYEEHNSSVTRTDVFPFEYSVHVTDA